MVLVPIPKTFPNLPQDLAVLGAVRVLGAELRDAVG